MLNTSDGIAYAYIMNHPDHGMLPAMIAHFSWLHIHGFPPVIYLILNKTVRNDTKALFKKIFSSLKIVKDSSVGSNNQQNIKNNTWINCR
uniref:Uncharacterized protein n=1 Tax=Meloidogyne incognita TaxID=6306 RepID=A0A914N844_MELIC